MIAIVDYGLGNVRAFANIYRELNIPHAIVSTPDQLAQASHIIIPGVGAFDQAVLRLREAGMLDAIEPLARDKKLPVLGVCVGMQILADRSEEGTERGLGWIPGQVVRFRQPSDGSRLPVPHMGWNNVRPVGGTRLFEGLEQDASFYFLHSFLFECAERKSVVATAEYGGEFACAVSAGNIFGVQFHPEKSHGYGIRLLKNFAEL
jgi:glutamine amidotransferase